MVISHDRWFKVPYACFFRAGSLALVPRRRCRGCPGPRPWPRPMGGGPERPGCPWHGHDGPRFWRAVHARHRQRHRRPAQSDRRHLQGRARADLKAQHDANAHCIPRCATSSPPRWWTPPPSRPCVPSSQAHDAVSKRMTQAAVDVARADARAARQAGRPGQEARRPHGQARTGLMGRSSERTLPILPARLLLVDDDTRLTNMVGDYPHAAGFMRSVRRPRSLPPAVHWPVAASSCWCST